MDIEVNELNLQIISFMIPCYTLLLLMDFSFSIFFFNL